MSSDNPKPTPKSADDLRREAAEMVQRRHRGLPAYRAAQLPIHASPDTESATKALAEGQALLGEKKFAAAMLKADSVTGLALSESDLWCDGMVLRGQIYIEQSAYQSARDTLRRVLYINPAHIQARLALADSYRRTGLLKRAIDLYVETIPVVPDPAARSKLHMVLADLYVAHGQPEMARKVLKMTEQPESVDVSSRIKAALTLLMPDGPMAWLFLIIGLFISVVASVNFSWQTSVLIIVSCVAVYGGIQWMRTPSKVG